MKRIRFITPVVMALAILTACSNKPKPSSTPSTSQSTEVSQTKQAANASTSSEETKASTSNTENPSTQVLPSMDIEAISQGDFSSIIGKWENDAGYSLTFNSLGLVGEDSLTSASSIVEGALETGVKVKNGGGYGLLMIPAGTPIPHTYFLEGEDTTDVKRDRMFGAQAVAKNTDSLDIYYRVSSKSSLSHDPLENDKTGVQLDGGSKTIEYADEILGQLNWQVLESNYNRTERIPFELLQGENGYLYRVYQNGVIWSQSHNMIVYIP